MTILAKLSESSICRIRIGKYQLINQLASGGMGTVYLGERIDKELDHRVAIKIINRNYVDSNILERFICEQQFLANLEHQYIARFLDAGSFEQNIHYYVMEYVQGVAIDEYCLSLTLPEKIKLFIKVCTAVSYAHENLILHRDLKPANILITINREPKLLDFGIAKYINQDGVSLPGDMTALHNYLLTPRYASPEQLLKKNLSLKSDIYSLGVLLYELITGKSPYPWENMTIAKLEEYITNGISTKPSTIINKNGNNKNINKKLIGQLRGDLDNILMKALSKEPSSRYASVNNFSNDLENYLNGFPIIARKISLYYRSLKFVKRQTCFYRYSTF